MKIFNVKVVQIGGAMCVLPLSCCSSKGLAYAQRGDGPQMIDAGPRAVMAIASEKSPLEIGGPGPVATLLPKSTDSKRRLSPPASVVMERNKKKAPKDFQSWLNGRN